MTNTCERCDAKFAPFTPDPTEGQLCPACLHQGERPVVRITVSHPDHDPRYFMGLHSAALFIDEGMVYGDWCEFNNEEYAGVREEWTSIPMLDARSIEALQASVNARSEFLREFWKRHYHDILVVRDREMSDWEAIRAGRAEKPIQWLEVPDFQIIVETVAVPNTVEESK